MTKRKKIKPQFYWAYGSNLNLEQMRWRCPAARKVAPLYLEDGVLLFRGVADVASKRRSIVAGGLWRITPTCEAKLDAYEGVDVGMYEKRYFPIVVGGETHDCLFYKMTHKGVMPPSEGYLAGIVQGYKDFGLDLTLLEAAVMHSWDRKHKTPEVRRRFRRAGRPTLARVLPSEEVL